MEQEQLITQSNDREKLLVERFKEAKEREKKAKLEHEAAKDALLLVEQELMELLDDQGKKSSAKFEGIGHVTCVAPRISASFIEGQEAIALEEIERLGRGDMIKRTVHPSTLSTFVKELLSLNQPLPPGVTYYEKRWLSFYPIKNN